MCYLSRLLNGAPIMSSTSHGNLSRSAAIARKFGARAHLYDANADLQRGVALRLATALPALAAPRVLELGCGTGLLSRQLIERYPDGTFMLTDLSSDMLDQCRRNLGDAGKRLTFTLMNAEQPIVAGPFDLIVMSMTLHWLDDPLLALEQLRKLLAPGGVLSYATLSGESFPEWREVLKVQGLPSGLIDMPALPGIFEEERIAIDKDPLAFLKRMKAVGGTMPKGSYRPLSPGALRRAIRMAEQRYGGRITWHIVYGRLGPSEASQSSPSNIPV